MLKYCPICGLSFETHNSRLVYCPGKDCAADAKRKRNREAMRVRYAETGNPIRRSKRTSQPFLVDFETADLIRKKGDLLIKTPRMEAQK